MNNILTSQTEPYELSFSRSFQNLTHLPPSYEMALKADLGNYLTLHNTSRASQTEISLQMRPESYKMVDLCMICHSSLNQSH